MTPFMAGTDRPLPRPAMAGRIDRELSMTDAMRITTDPAIMLGKPIVRGTRITVEHILDELAGGLSIDDLVASHPRLTRDDIRAALAFAAESVRTEGMVAVRAAS